MQKKDISKEFKEMNISAFDEFLFNLSLATNNQLILAIHTDDINQAKRLKAIKEYYSYNKFQFQIEIEATIEEHRKELNVFASGIKWIEKK